MFQDSRESVEKEIERKPPSLKIYFSLFLAVVLLIAITIFSPEGIWQNFFLNLSTDLIIAIVILILIEQKFRESEINFIKELYLNIKSFSFAFLIPSTDYRFSIYLQQVSKIFYFNDIDQWYISRPIDQFIQNLDKNVMIIGNNGSGKTVLLFQTFRMKLQKYIAHENNKIPVFFSLPKVANSLKESLKIELNNYSWISEQDFENYLEKGRFVFIIDSAIPDFRPGLWLDTLEFVKKYSLCQYIFATPRIYERNLAELYNFEFVKLPRLTEEEYTDSLRKRY